MPRATLARWTRRPRRASAELLDRCGLGDRRDDHPYRLSYGQKRRLNLISVLSYAPRLILLDEVLIGQDPANAAFLLDLLREHVAQRRRGDHGQPRAQGHPPLCQPPALFRQRPHRRGCAPPSRPLSNWNRWEEMPMSPERIPRFARLTRITYQPGDSFLHRLHPLTKAAWLLFGTVLVFVVRSPWAGAGAVALLLLAFPVVGRAPGPGARHAAVRHAPPCCWGCLQVLFVHEGAVLFELGPLTVTAGGVEAGVYVAGRFLSVILLSYLFVLTTEPNDLAYALMRAGLPYRYGFALITALRLVPTFEQEGQIVYNAQLARGVRYDVREPAPLSDPGPPVRPAAAGLGPGQGGCPGRLDGGPLLWQVSDAHLSARGAGDVAGWGLACGAGDCAGGRRWRVG